MNDGKLMRIGELSKEMHITTRTIDYYTNLGIIDAQRPSSNAYRYYDEEAVIRLKLIQSYKQENLSLNEIKQRFELMDNVKNYDEDIITEINDFQHELKDLEEAILKLKPKLDQLDKDQLHSLGRLINIQGISLAQTITLLFG
ncbi:MerR family transcriptional regulator [Virgibacillus phasianinus]|uniref:MerR family transcriptional regulator n=2 Tax=Virgibacillus phasianinus TaxID=2017483 RepID=A0A220U6Z3_9BACI|nr:MerR family transcriptional regulator [Virgibacillus phasianinus]